MYELSIIIPTLNERENISPLISALQVTFSAHNIQWEAVFVDDNSTDGTLDEIKTLSKQCDNIRFIHRLDSRGLSSACAEGMLSSTAAHVAVIDADLQHDESILPIMLNELKKGMDIAIGSRNIEGGSMGTMPIHRQKVSQFAAKLSDLFLGSNVTDPMSGFFMLKRELIENIANKLTLTGYKLLLDILVNAPKGTNIVEVPYNMRHRIHGESKLDTLVVLEYLNFLIEKTIGRFIPAKFVMFAAVGASGVVVHLLSLAFLYHLINITFIASQSLATMIAMTTNYIANNLTTYREQRLHGSAFLKGLISFYLACSLGALINIIIADYLKETSYAWWAAGLTGALIGSIWNFSMTKTFTWKK